MKFITDDPEYRGLSQTDCGQFYFRSAMKF